jgi:hypothetical protein
MINYLGKTLVFVNLLLSVALLAWAVGIYTQKVDWGWKEPRKELGERVPSEIDKRLVAWKEAQRVKAAVVGTSDPEGKKAPTGIAAEERNLRRYQFLLPSNHLAYDVELKRLASVPGQIEIKRLDIDKGKLKVNEANLLPVFDGNVTYTDPSKKTLAVDQSYDTYRAHLRDIGQQIDAVTVAIKEQIKQEENLTRKLNGGKAEGKEGRPGLYDLLLHEGKVQDELKKETAYVRPRWVRELVDVQLLLERREGLQERLDQLKAYLTGRPVARR